MKKTILTFGLLSGLIVSILMITNIAFFDESLGENGMWIGYATMIIAFSMIFVGVKSHRDKHNDGYITFGQAFIIGLLITLITSTMYVISWEIYSACCAPDFMEKYAAAMIAQLKAKGASAAEIAKQTTVMEEYKAMYKNPVFKIMMVYMEILPVGIIISLLAAFILKRKPVTLTG